MVDKIANHVSNLDVRSSKNNSKSSKIVESLENAETIDNVSSSIKSSKKVISELASAAPVDADKVSKIKQAISSGRYPLDLDKISDALMQAYREMKS
tara:strand:- start:166 stop:456 length:291 start_codon:yes stop_codon:yes gene_type:complete